MVFKKLKNFFQRKKSKKEDIPESQLGFKLVLKKNGERTKDFDDLVKKLIKTLEDKGLTDEEFSKELFGKKEKFIETGQYYTVFSLPITSLLSKNARRKFDLAKKEFQLFLSKNTKYKDFTLVNVMTYHLNKKEKKSPIDFIQVLCDIYAYRTGIRIDIKAKDFFPETHIKIIQELQKVDYYLDINTKIFIDKLDVDFYNKVKKLYKYLIKNNLTLSPPDEKDMKKRYDDAIIDFKNEFTNHMMEKENGIDKKKAKKIADEALLKLYHLTYIFGVDLRGILLEDFIKIENDFFNNLSKVGLTFDYEVELTTFPLASSNYSCFVYFQSLVS